MTDSGNLKVLLSDDDTSMRLLIKTVVKSMGHELVGEAKNGQEAVDMYRELKPDILLLDINMPVKNGEEALKEIMSEFPDAFVIMLTSFKEKDSIEDCFKFGAANYIPKDTPRKEMKIRIEETWTKFKGKMQ